MDVDGLDRESSAGGRGRPRPRVLSWWACPALTECPQLVDVDGLDRVSSAGPRVLSWWTCPALTECPQLADVDAAESPVVCRV